ncbi:unnamed protein product [Parascedosporium putredinis]|uniref:CRAL-TRIO domain-containing protein n=1 Tax=Parascedosporium putredinis TaxID=1442378 RepID=A0A9P1H2L5_9PEZI|nr:unnamed protein product [Parascedosporium putredinis]CAI7994934.1 unnamed protein product [Parascedosporium putredinis]
MKAVSHSKTPIASPIASTKVPARPELTPAEQVKYDELLKQVRTWTEIKVESAKASEKSGPITDDERLWLTRECLIRYLRATKWHEKESEKRLHDTLAWRREFGADELTAEYISPENETGKQMLLGYDTEGRPCHYLSPGRQNTEPSHRQVEHLVYMVDRVIDIMPPGQETLSLMINFKQSKSRKYTAPGLGLARECLNILQMHYPERLGRALIVNVPFMVWGFFKLITPFIDPRTREKLKFNEDMTQYVPSEQLWSEYQDQGKLDFDYDHAEYWPALSKMCEEKRKERKERWVAGGKQIGESEDYLWGGAEPSIGADALAPEDKKTETTPEDLKVAELKIEEAEVVKENTEATASTEAKTSA